MKTAILGQIITLVAALFVIGAAGAFGVCLAQSPEAAENPVPAAAGPSPAALPMGEDDDLPFMRSEEQSVAGAATNTGTLALRALGSMILIVGLIFCGAWGLKKYGPAGFRKAGPAADRPDLTVLATVSLGGGRSISTVRFGEKILLVGATAQAVTLLADAEVNDSNDPAPILAAENRSPRSVAEMLAEESAAFTPPADFGAEFERAAERLANRRENGGKLS